MRVKLFVFLAVAVSLALGLSVRGQTGGPAKNVEIIYPYKTPPGVTLEKNVYLTMRDGVKLAMDVYKPATGSGPWPVILGMAPYPKESLFETINIGYFVSHGYVVVNLVVRGSGMSEGQYSFFSKEENLDGYDIVEGLAKQPWSNGNIGMFGASYLGMNQWQTAGLRPPHLKCVVPYATTTDLYRESHYPGGVFNQAFVTMWWNINSGRFTWPWPGIAPAGKKLPLSFQDQALAHPFDGPYYWGIGSDAVIPRIEVPTYSIAWGMGFHSLVQLHSWPLLTAKNRKLMVTTAGVNYQNNLGMNERMLRWFDTWLKGIDTGIMKEPTVEIYDQGTGTWRYENEYPLARTKWTKFYLRSNPAGPATKEFSEGTSEGGVALATVWRGPARNQPWGRISTEPPTGSEDPDTYSVKKPPLMRQVTPEYVAFTTAPLEKDVTLQGPVSVTLFGSADTAHTATWAWFVRVGEIAPDGKYKELVDGNLKASFREVDKDKSRTGEPWHPFQKAVYLEPRKIYDFEIQVRPIFYTFKAGSRISVRIAGQAPGFMNESVFDPVVQGEGPIPARISVYHDAEHPSHLLLPVIPDAPEIAPVSKALSDIVPAGPTVAREFFMHGMADQ